MLLTITHFGRYRYPKKDATKINKKSETANKTREKKTFRSAFSRFVAFYIANRRLRNSSLTFSSKKIANLTRNNASNLRFRNIVSRLF